MAISYFESYIASFKISLILVNAVLLLDLQLMDGSELMGISGGGGGTNLMLVVLNKESSVTCSSH